jgi:hypothetical protein
VGDEEKWTYAVIFDRNVASQGMFRGMGWIRGWGRAWVTIGGKRSGDDTIGGVLTSVWG